MVVATETEERRKFHQSLVTRRKLDGVCVTGADLDAKRAGTGIVPDEIAYVIGRRLSSDLAADQVLHRMHLQ
jgi:sialic acid synthase SpsE